MRKITAHQEKDDQMHEIFFDLRNSRHDLFLWINALESISGATVAFSHKVQTPNPKRNLVTSKWFVGPIFVPYCIPVPSGERFCSNWTKHNHPSLLITVAPFASLMSAIVPEQFKVTVVILGFFCCFLFVLISLSGTLSNFKWINYNLFVFVIFNVCNLWRISD